MKKRSLTLILFLTVSLHLMAQQNDFPNLTGPYLGQKPPGEKVEVFAPGIIKYEVHDSPSISEDLNEILIGSMDEGVIYYVLKNGVWSLSKRGSFPFPKNNNGMSFSPSGQKIYYLLWENNDENFYVSEKKNNKWSDIRSLGDEVNSLKTHWQFSAAQNENLYFSSGGKIVVSVFKRNKHLKPVHIKLENNEILEGTTPFISPDESYMLLSCGTTNDYKTLDIHISYNIGNGKWSLPKNLGIKINSADNIDLCPRISPDGKYLFFISRRPGPDFRVFWVSASFIEELKPEGL